MRAALAATLVLACGSGPGGPAGGPVAGAPDTHCTLTDGGVKVQPVNAASCNATGGTGTVNYGPVRDNAEADDDDCKYHVKFTSSPVYRNSDVTFTVTATEKASGAVAAHANVAAEVFLDPTHPAPNSGQKTVETSTGTYQVGPVRFDAAGQWTVRFHLHEECGDATADSPHGHVAFYVMVP